MTPSMLPEQGNSAATPSTPIADPGSVAIERAAERATYLAQRGLDAVRGTSRELRHKALDVSDKTVTYIKDEPVKSMLIAAATGAALMALITLISRSRHHG